MKLYVDVTKLTDSPYSGSNLHPFIFDQANVNELVSDITIGNPTCYLISGYRGAGKSSFVKKVEQSIDAEKKILFVHTSFAKYHSHNFLLRKLIRGLYQTIKKEENQTTYNHLLEGEVKANEHEENKTSVLLGELYERTFHDISKSISKQDLNEEEQKISVDLLLFTGFSLVFLLSLSNLIYPWIGMNAIPTVIALIGSAVASVRQFMSISATSTRTETHSKEFNRKTLYDEEISGYHFSNLLIGLSNKEIKVVFVLDELDKVKENEVNDLLNEMKPYLVSGLASFIVVAGQNLFYKYKYSASVDDSILSTLFSRVIHVPLLSAADFNSLFRQLIDKTQHPTEIPDSEYQIFLEYLIFKSKRIPRKFINLIREKIYWEGEKAYLDIDTTIRKYKVCSEIINAIKKIDDEQISVSFSGGSRDYLCMQLFIKAEKILGMDWKNCTFSKENLFN
ncbi:MAG TPA: P-loop NTPase fold protein [Chitinophagaceae bacterium]|nr:P-loop NTPase fold protein [Chitinophagaceae bacterium]